MFVSLLGSPEISIDQHPLEGLRRKNRALVYYLAAHREPQTRDQVLALFWPDTPRPAAQQSLRTMLSDLRRQLGAGCFNSDDERLSLAGETRVDVREFQAGLASPNLEISTLTRILDLYHGDFLDGFTLADSPSFDDWAAAEREHYRLAAMRGFASLSRLYEIEKDPASALAALNRALAIDPLQEELQREGLRLHYLSGDRAGAIRRYELLCKLLDQELGVPPMPETRAVYDAIVNDRLPLIQPPAAHPAAASAQALHPGQAAPLLPFTGRAGDLEQLKAVSASGKMILVEGAPGIGKTRLVEEFLRASQKPSPHGSNSPIVLHGAAHEFEQGLPYQPVVDALRGLLGHPEWITLRASLNLSPVWWGEILRLLPDLQPQFPEINPAPASTDEARLWEAVSQFVQSLAHRRQVVIFIDDLHWADISTVGLLGYLARRIASPSILLLATSRPISPHEKLAAAVKSLIHEGRLAPITLSPLSEEDTLAVAAQVSPSHADQLSQWLLENAEGNPYFLTELVRHAHSSHFLNEDGQLQSIEESSAQFLPPTIQNLILSRIMRLSEVGRRVLEAAAVIGREFDFELVQATLSAGEGGPASASETATLDGLDELQTAVIILPRGGERFSFDHSLTLEVVLQDMGGIRCRRLHRQVAQALERLHVNRIDPNAGSIAYHYRQGNLPERAAPSAFRAGKYAAGLAAWAEAIAFFEQAFQAETDLDQRVSILLALGDAQFHMGDLAHSTDTFRTSLDLANASSDLANLEASYLALNKSLIPQSRFSEAIDLGRQLAQSGPPELALCAQFIWGAGLSVESAFPMEAEAHLHEAERLLAKQPNYRGSITRALLCYQLAAAVGQQRSGESVALYREALALSEKDESALDLLRRIMLYNNLAYHLFLVGDPSAAEYARAGIKLAQERGSLTHMPYLLSTSGEIALGNDQLDEAERLFTEGLSLAEQLPMVERIAGLTANLGLVDRRRGKDDRARERFSAALVLADQLGARHLAVRIRIWLIPLLPFEQASLRLREARQIAEESGFGQLLEEINSLKEKSQLE